MATGVNILCYKSKTLANGEHPLMIRICKDGKKKYVGLGISVLPQFWDFKKNKPKRNCPNKERIEKLIASKINEYNDLILELTTDRQEYTPEAIVDTLNCKLQIRTVDEFYCHIIDDLRKNGKLGNAEVYNYSYNSLREFASNRLEIPFRNIDLIWLKRYEDWLRKRNCQETTISQLFRTLRSIYNKAIENSIVKRDHYPFEKYKISKFDTSTNKRAITKEDIYRIMELDLSNKPLYMKLAKDMFIFSYFGAGINFSDIALLKFSDIKNGRAYYIRKKTNKPINFQINEIANSIIQKYSNGNEDFIFPILNNKTHKTEQQRHDRIHKSLRKVNRELRKIGEMIGVDNLTTYVARHSYATVLKRAGVNIAIISESLGHSDLATTQIYLDSFENSQIDEAMKNLL